MRLSRVILFLNFSGLRSLYIPSVSYTHLGSEADIVATYRMKNTTDENISTRSMFLSPNIKNSGVKVAVNGKNTFFTVEKYALNYSTEIKTDDWQYVVLTDDEIASHNGEQTVDTITFEMDFAPYEEYDVIAVSYTHLDVYKRQKFNLLVVPFSNSISKKCYPRRVNLE